MYSTFIRDAKECLRRPLLRLFISEIPNSVLEGVLFPAHRPDLGQYPHFKPTHREQQLRVIARIYAHECILPFNRCQGSRQALLHIPEYCTAQVDVMFNQAHAAVTRPATLVVVSNDVIVSWIRVGTEIPLDKVARLICGEAEED